MIEVLVSLVILSIALLGIGSLQILTIKSTRDAHLRTQASIAIMNLTSKMRVNLEGVEQGAYAQASPLDCSSSTKSCINTSCTFSESARYDLYQVACGTSTDSSLSSGLNDSLPNGKLSVTCAGAVCNKTTEHVITISWASSEVDTNRQPKIKTVSTPVKP